MMDENGSTCHCAPCFTVSMNQLYLLLYFCIFSSVRLSCRCCAVCLYCTVLYCMCTAVFKRSQSAFHHFTFPHSCLLSSIPWPCMCKIEWFLNLLLLNSNQAAMTALQVFSSSVSIRCVAAVITSFRSISRIE
jgi:hypothetical protein